MPFVIAPLSDVKGLNGYPEFRAAMAAAEKAALERANVLWPGELGGGIVPGQNQFGIGPLRKNDMAGDTTDSTISGSYTFRKNYTALGWTDALRYTVRNDMINAFVGFLVTDDVLRLSHFRMEIGQRLFPIWDVQAAQIYSRFAIVLKVDAGAELVADPKTRVLLRTYVESTGFQRVIPLGFQLFRRPDLVISET